MLVANNWKEYQILDMSNGEKLEMWGKYKFLRPDPQIIWNNKMNKDLWTNIDAHYHRNNKGGGYWEYKKNIPETFVINYRDLKFKIGLMGFKHTGLFPEQAVNWDYFIDKITRAKQNRTEPIKVLNLFAYTGAASVVALRAGASVVHVDSSRGMVDWAKENVRVNNLDESMVRYIVDDVIKFVSREIRRGNKYDVIIMDPPSFGRGANGEVWDIEKDLFHLLKLCKDILSEEPLLFLVNSYSGLSPSLLENLLNLTINKTKPGKITSAEIGLPIKVNDLVLPCGIYGRIDYE